ncbi:hypothetical protein UPYG_G00112970 [Umbra pygmaea]|uniref:Uncharacterized protein n=1 Tax=Umbra pygmaea TaxID=75934 RepID=A0ABD0X361_UMBPY
MAAISWQRQWADTLQELHSLSKQVAAIRTPDKENTDAAQESSSSTVAPHTRPVITTPDGEAIHILSEDSVSENEQLGIETGYDGSGNIRFAYMWYTAQSLGQDDCYMCGKARPELGMHPFSLQGDLLNCVLSGFYGQNHADNGSTCVSLRSIVPTAPPHEPPRGVKAYGGNYICITQKGDGSNNVENVTASWCGTMHPLHSNVSSYNMTNSLADIWLICGGNTLHSMLISNWTSICAITSIVLPINIVNNPSAKMVHALQRTRRAVPWDKEAHDEVYKNVLAVPTGVPTEFQALSKDDGWWHLLPIIGPAIGSQKQCSWINYIYYNQQRFLNHTISALTGLAEQLDATSKNGNGKQNGLRYDPRRKV